MPVNFVQGNHNGSGNYKICLASEDYETYKKSILKLIKRVARLYFPDSEIQKLLNNGIIEEIDIDHVGFHKSINEENELLKRLNEINIINSRSIVDLWRDSSSTRIEITKSYTSANLLIIDLEKPLVYKSSGKDTYWYDLARIFIENYKMKTLGIWVVFISLNNHGKKLDQFTKDKLANIISDCEYKIREIPIITNINEVNEIIEYNCYISSRRNRSPQKVREDTLAKIGNITPSGSPPE